MSFQFKGQRPKEEIVLFARQHPFCLLHSLLWTLVVLLVPLVFYIFLVFGSLFFYILVVCLVAAVWRLAHIWYGWANSLFLLTNERVLVVRQKGFIHREVAECTLGSIQQIHHDVGGLLGTLFNYGKMEIALGSSQSSIVVKNLPQPYDIQQEVLRAAKLEG